MLRSALLPREIMAPLVLHAPALSPTASVSRGNPVSRSVKALVYMICHDTCTTNATHLFATRLPFPILTTLLHFLEKDVSSVILLFASLSMEQGIMSSFV